MIFPSRSFRQILFRTKAARLNALTFSSDFASARFSHYLIPLKQTRRSRCTNRVSNIPVVAFTTRFLGECQPCSTQASPEKEETILSEIITAFENTPRSASKLCTARFEKLCRAGNLSVAAGLLRSLHDKRFPVSSDAINVLLAAAGEKNDVELVSRVFTDVIASSVPLPSTTYLCIAKVFADIDDHTRLLKFTEDVAEVTFPSTKTLNRILLAFGETRQIDHALTIFDHIKGLNWEQDLVTRNIVLEILGRASRVDKLLHEFDSIKKAGISPDVVSYNTLLNGLRKVGRVDMCAAYYREMGDNGIQPNLLTYTAMIESVGRSGNVEEALRLFDEMKSRQIRPSIYIYRSLVNSLKKMGKLELATRISEEMKSCSISDMARPSDFKRNKR